MVVAGLVLLREEAITLDRLEEIGGMMADTLRGGDVVLFYGPLAAGKTAMIRAVARGLRVTDPVRSPSFTLANIYSGTIVVQHLDLYRLETIGDEDTLALEEYLRDDAVTLVEWPQAGLARLGRAHFAVTLEHHSLDRRSIEIVAYTQAAADRWRGVEADRGG